MFNKLIESMFKKPDTKDIKRYQIVVEGAPDHKHKFREIEWDNSLGDEVILLNEDYAQYRELQACECGRKRIKSEVALI